MRRFLTRSRDPAHIKTKKPDFQVFIQSIQSSAQRTGLVKKFQP